LLALAFCRSAFFGVVCVFRGEIELPLASFRFQLFGVLAFQPFI